MRSNRFVLLGVAAVIATVSAIGGGSAGGVGRRQACVSTPVVVAAEAPTAIPGVAQEDVPANRKTDDAAVRKTLDGLASAFQKGDAKGVAAQWTPDGEYIEDDGATFRGRAELQKAYAEFFTKNPDNVLTVEVNEIRFPSKDNAVVEAHFKLHKGKKRELIVSRCSFLMTREDGKWLIAIAREWPGDGLSLRDLEFLIGTWEAKRDGVVVSTKYEWAANKNFIRCQFSITQDGKTHSGMQMIGKDPAAGGLHVWTFEDNGGIGDTDITRDGKKWIFIATGATAEGKTMAAKNIMTPIDGDSFLWQSVERTVDDVAMPDLPPTKVMRVKSK